MIFIDMKMQLNEVQKLQKIAGLLEDIMSEDNSFTNKVRRECESLNISWEENDDNPRFPIHVKDENGHELWLNVDEKKKNIEAMTQGYSDDIYIGEIGNSGKDVEETLSALTDEWYKENDPNGDRF